MRTMAVNSFALRGSPPSSRVVPEKRGEVCGRAVATTVAASGVEVEWVEAVGGVVAEGGLAKGTGAHSCRTRR